MSTVCGLGGATQAAKQAGPTPIWGIEKEEGPRNTYESNHEESHLYRMHSKKFLEEEKRRLAAVLHLSPSCQSVSKAHSTPGKDDEENRNTLLEQTHQVIKAMRPRFVPFEEVPGLVQEIKHLDKKNMALNQLLKLDFTLRWLFSRVHHMVYHSRGRD